VISLGAIGGVEGMSCFRFVAATPREVFIVGMSPRDHCCREAKE
jgi:hypothetical protein